MRIEKIMIVYSGLLDCCTGATQAIVIVKVSPGCRVICGISFEEEALYATCSGTHSLAASMKRTSPGWTIIPGRLKPIPSIDLENRSAGFFFLLLSALFRGQTSLITCTIEPAATDIIA